VALAQQGLPQAGNVGFSTLEKGGITTSEFVQQVEYQQALEGQLAQTFEASRASGPPRSTWSCPPRVPSR